MRQPRRAFTQVELLIVISVIALLVAIFLPMIYRARERGNRVLCAGNLKQVGLALQMYSNNERTGGYPRTLYVPNAPLILGTAGYGDAAGPFDVTTGVNNVGASFYHLLKTQGLAPACFVCPSGAGTPGLAGGTGAVAASSNFRGFSATSSVRDCTYSYQLPFPSGPQVGGIEFPPVFSGRRYFYDNAMSSDFAVAADVNPGTRAAAGSGTPVTAIAYNAPRSAIEGANSRNHRGDGQNVLYADGHVEWQRTPFAGGYRTTPITYRDNIYVGGSSTTTGTGGAVDGGPNTLAYDRLDSILLPTDN